MKTVKDPRHLKRIKIMRELFAWEFSPKKTQLAKQPQMKNTQEIIKQLPKIDQEIKKAAPQWPLSQINRLDLAILRLAIFELIIKKDTPFKVVVDEAVELAKEFGSESSPEFINGVLGYIISAHQLDKEKEESSTSSV